MAQLSAAHHQFSIPIPFINRVYFESDPRNIKTAVSLNINDTEREFREFLGGDERMGKLSEFMNKNRQLNPDPDVRNKAINTEGVCADCTAKSINSGDDQLIPSVALPGVVNRHCADCLANKYQKLIETTSRAKVIVCFKHRCGFCDGTEANCRQCMKQTDTRKHFCRYCRNSFIKQCPCKNGMSFSIQKFNHSEIKIKFQVSDQGENTVNVLGMDTEFEYFLTDEFDEILSGLGCPKKFTRRFNEFSKFIVVINKPIKHPETRLTLNGHFIGKIKGHYVCVNKINNICHAENGHRSDDIKAKITPPPMPSFQEGGRDGVYGISLDYYCVVCREVEDAKKNREDYRDQDCRICRRIQKIL